jgi:hypothetical protein
MVYLSVSRPPEVKQLPLLSVIFNVTTQTDLSPVARQVDPASQTSNELTISTINRPNLREAEQSL